EQVRIAIKGGIAKQAELEIGVRHLLASVQDRTSPALFDAGGCGDWRGSGIEILFSLSLLHLRHREPPAGLSPVRSRAGTAATRSDRRS
ncbi:hypothetical protein, partial [Asaia bogorensis]|uniref:hypothetical protein n=1 Tax=Asaia bogorensis TaxID=91915 RepID=UPI0030196531